MRKPAIGIITLFGLSFAIFASGADFDGDGTNDIGIFRETTGLWAVRGFTRVYFGHTDDWPLPGDYDGDGTIDIGVFRDSTGLWAVRGLTRTYYGGYGDEPLIGMGAGGGRWGQSGENIYFDGNVGIGTDSPTQKLEVDGGIKLGDTATPEAGVIRWTGTEFQGYDGYDWSNFAASTAVGNLWSKTGSDIYYSLGNVGIGTDSPGSLLNIKGNRPVLSIEGTPSYWYGSLLWRSPNSISDVEDMVSITTDWGNYFDGSESTDLVFKTRTDGAALAEVMRIKSGNVGIGTTTPNHPLDVEGDIRYSGILRSKGPYSGDSGKITIIPESVYLDGGFSARITAAGFGHGNAIQFFNGGGGTPIEVMRLTYDGNVGIGTTSPSGRLSVKNEGTGNCLFIHQDGVLGGGPSYKHALYISSNTNQPASSLVRIRQSNTSAASPHPLLWLDQYGKGPSLCISAYNDVGYNSYGALMVTAYAAQTTPGAVIAEFSSTNGSSTSDVVGIDNDGSGSGLLIRQDNTLAGGKHALYIHSNYTQDTDDTALAYIYQNGEYSTEPALEIKNDGSGPEIEVNTDEFVVKGGNVGIGTTSPGEKLEVNGNAKINGTLDMNKNAAKNFVIETLAANPTEPVQGQIWLVSSP